MGKDGKGRYSTYPPSLGLAIDEGNLKALWAFPRSPEALQKFLSMEVLIIIEESIHLHGHHAGKNLMRIPLEP